MDDTPEEYYRIKYLDQGSKTKPATGWPDGESGSWYKLKKKPIRTGRNGKASAERKRKLILEFGPEDPCCGYCGITLNSTTATIDHIRPKSQSGTNATNNLVLACKTCNNKKGAEFWEVKYGPRKGSRPLPLRGGLN